MAEVLEPGAADHPDSPEYLMAGVAERLVATLPAAVVRVVRDRTLTDRMTGRPGRPVRLQLLHGDVVLELIDDPAPDGVTALVLHRVRGVVISRRVVPLPHWLELVAERMRLIADEAAAAHEAAHRLGAVGGPRPVEPAAPLLVVTGDPAADLVTLPGQLLGRVSAEVVAEVEAICAALLDTLPRVSGSFEQSEIVRRTATDYLPSTLNVYLALPRSWAESEPVHGDSTALEELREQLATLRTGADRMLAAALEADADRLLANGYFLRQRFDRSDLDDDPA